MSDELKFPGPGATDRDSLGEPLTSLVREAYQPTSAAGAEAYWAGLEQRIMARVRTAPAEPGWWSVLAPWAQAGLIAATAIFALTSFINREISESESQYAYESVVPVSAPTSALSEALGTGPDRTHGNDAALDYVLSH